MNTVKTAGSIFRNPNVICLFLCLTLFFGLIVASHIKINQNPPAKVRKLSVKYRGNKSIGNALIKRGKRFLADNRYIFMNDKSMLKDLYSFFENRPEVEHIYYVKKIFPDTLEIKLMLRNPFVKVGKVYFDKEGCRLPREFTSIARKKPIPYISGIRTPRTLGAGEIWKNVYFQETLQALKMVKGMVSVNKVMVPGSNGGVFANGIVLQTKEGACIYWGKVFQESPLRGISTEMKLRNLEKALNIITNNMDKVKYVDVSREKPVIKYKLEVS